MVGSRGRRENTGASVVSPWGDQNPLVVQSVKGQGMPSSLTSENMLWYCAARPIRMIFYACPLHVQDIQHHQSLAVLRQLTSECRPHSYGPDGPMTLTYN